MTLSVEPGGVSSLVTDLPTWTEGQAQSRSRWPHLPGTGRKEIVGRTCLMLFHPMPIEPSTQNEFFVCYFGWTGRCCLYPLVSRSMCWWLGTVSLTINLSFLQLIQGGRVAL